MKMICPTCASNADCRNRSRFHIYQCSQCDTAFRGIHADVNTVNATIRTLSRMVFPLYMFTGGDALNHWETPCPFCWNDVPLTKATVGYNSPKFCSGCRNELPKDKISTEPTQKKAQKLVDQGKLDIPEEYRNQDVSFLFEQL